MENAELAFWLTILGTGCWAICFFWMHKISSKQNQMLTELKAQNKRIEELSREEHKLIREVHPQVGEIKDSVQEIVNAAKDSK